MSEELRPFAIQLVAIGGAAIGLWFFWKLARAVVKWGFFVMYFILGCLIGLFFQPHPSVGVTLAAGLAFAWTVMAIQAKIWKLVAGAAVILAIPFFGPVEKAISQWVRSETPAKRDAAKPLPRPSGKNSSPQNPSSQATRKTR